MKKFILAFAAAMFLFSAAVYADDIKIVADGRPVVFPDQQPEIVEDRTLVPVRGVFEMLGFDVGWEQETSTAVLTNNEYEVRITIGQAVFYTNGIAYELDVPAQLINDRTMVPLRFPLESVHFSLQWDNDTRTIMISDCDDHDHHRGHGHAEAKPIANVSINGRAINWVSGAEPFRQEPNIMVPLAKTIEELGGTSREDETPTGKVFVYQYNNRMLFVKLDSMTYAFIDEIVDSYEDAWPNNLEELPLQRNGDVFIPLADFVMAFDIEYGPARDGTSIVLITS